MKNKIILLTILILSKTAYGQLNPLGSSYYINQYLTNVAFVGLMPNLELNAAFKTQWTGIEDRPTMQVFTAGYGFINKKVGIGVTFYHESAGVFNKLNFKTSYAYHLLVNQNSRLDFGLSLGLADESINFNKVQGDITDPTLINFQNRSVYIDGDFGTIFKHKGLSLQAAIPNLNRLLRKTIYNKLIDNSLYMAAASYILFENDSTKFYTIEPKIVIRKIKSNSAIVDVGVNGELFNKALLLSAIYHTTNNLTLGLGVNVKKRITILTQYTANTSAFQAYNGGEFEIGLRYN